MHVCVVGGGIIGLLTSRALLAKGCTVTLLDDAGCPPASWAGGGILSPLYAWRYPDAMNALTVAAVDDYRQLLSELAGPDQQAAILQQGGLWVQVDEAEQALAQHWAQRWQLTAEPSVLNTLLPQSEPESGLFFPAIANIRNPRLLRLLWADLQRRGVRILKQRVSAIVPRAQGGARLETLSAGSIDADRVVLSAGHAGAGLLAGLGVRLPLFPAKGEMLLYRVPAGTVPAVILTEQGYLIPRQDGALLVGSTLRKGDASSYPTVAGRYQLEALAARLLPTLRQQRPLHHWAGVRPGCDRPYPYIGEVPGCPGLFAALGHYRNGLVAAPASATLLADLVCADRPAIDPRPYRLAID